MPQHEVKARCFSIVNQFARFQNTRRRRKGTDQYLVYSPLKYKHDSLYVLLRTFSTFPPLEFLVHLVHTFPLVCPPTRFVYESVCIGNVPPVIKQQVRIPDPLSSAVQCARRNLHTKRKHSVLLKHSFIATQSSLLHHHSRIGFVGMHS